MEGFFATSSLPPHRSSSGNIFYGDASPQATATSSKSNTPTFDFTSSVPNIFAYELTRTPEEFANELWNCSLPNNHLNCYYAGSALLLEKFLAADCNVFMLEVDVDGKKLTLAQIGTDAEPTLEFSYQGTKSRVGPLTIDAWAYQLIEKLASPCIPSTEMYQDLFPVNPDLLSKYNSGYIWENINFRGANLNPNFFTFTVPTIFGRPDFRDATLAALSMRGFNLRGAQFCNADLRYIDLSHATLSKSLDKNGALHETDFTKANLSHASLYWANLNFANFSHAILFKANFANAIMQQARLDYGDFRDANFTYAWLENVSILGADFTGADLGNVAHFTITIPEYGHGSSQPRKIEEDLRKYFITHRDNRHNMLTTIGSIDHKHSGLIISLMHQVLASLENISLSNEIKSRLLRFLLDHPAFANDQVTFEFITKKILVNEFTIDTRLLFNCTSASKPLNALEQKVLIHMGNEKKKTPIY